MKKFRFRLEPVLQQKLTLEEKALLEQTNAEQDFVKCELELNITKRKLQEAIAYAETIAGSKEQMQSFIYVEHLQQTLERQGKLLSRAKEILQVKREKVSKARQDRMIIEKLKEKHFMEFKELEQYIEQKENDELATLMFLRVAHSL